jgi:hypothetical protein
MEEKGLALSGQSINLLQIVRAKIQLLQRSNGII